jgi:hypothetical protein
MPYLAYLLRLWSSEQEGRRIWRASLESAHDSERVVFPDLEALIVFLRQRTEQMDSTGENGRTSSEEPVR